MTIPMQNPENATPLMDATDQEEATAEAHEKQQSGAAGMRAKIEEQQARIRELEGKYEADVGTLKEQAMAQAYAAIELNPEEGIGRAVAVTFEGEPEQLAEFAETEFGHVASGRAHLYQGAINAGHAALDQVGQSAGSIPVTPTEGDALAKAEASRDNQTTMQIKSEQLGRLMGR